MEDGLAIKANALEVLERQLAVRAKKNQYGFVAVGSATDAYIHHEEKYRITEGMLQLLLKYRFPVFISTKRTLITRDIELLKEIDKTAILPGDLKEKLNRGLILSVSVSTLDEKISHTLEPGTIPPMERLKLVKQLKQEGFLVGVNAMPVLPFISDTREELEKIIATVKEYGAAQVELWRRSYAVRPPDGESLEDTYKRTVPYYQLEIEPKLKANENILIVAHGNSLRALMMYLESIDPQAIAKVDLPTGIPRHYIFNDNLNILSVANL